HDRDTVTALTNKYAQRQRLAAAGLDGVRSTEVTSRDEVLAALAGRDGPVVVKPRRSQSSIDTFLLTGPELPAELAPTPDRPFVVEDYLAGVDQGEFGDFVSVETLVDPGGSH